MDKILDYDTKGEKLEETEENDFEYRRNKPEDEHPPGSESTEISVGFHTVSPKKISRDHKVSHCQAENTRDMKHHTESSFMQPETKLVRGDNTSDNLGSTAEDRVDVMEVGLEVEAEADTETSTEDKIETEPHLCSDLQLRQKQCEADDRETSELHGRATESGESGTDRDESEMPPDECTSTEDSARESGSMPTLGQECGTKRSGFRTPCIQQHHDSRKVEEKCCESMHASKWTPSSVTCKPLKHKRAKLGPDQGTNGPKISHEGANGGGELQNQSKAGCLTAALTSDPRVRDCGKLNPEEKMVMLKKAGEAKALVLTLVYRDGTTQLDADQKLTPAVCGLLMLMKNDLDGRTPEDSLGQNDSLVYLKLEHTPAWAQQHTHQSQELFTRDMLLQVLSRSQLVVCYKAKDLLRTALQFYRRDLSWKQVAGCHVQDPQVSGWLLDPANPSSCYQELLNKHCKRPHTTPALGTKKVTQVISGLCSLYRLNMELCFKLKCQGLWELYSDMELNMISVLAAMESHRIHVDKEALKRTSDLLGTKMKQLEQEAHRAAGQIFLVTSNTQLRTVLFEKLCLHERCENKKLPKTINKQQQSTSEAALLQLQDLHPLPKIILEYRQVHKIKSTFVDGILSCMMNKNHISSTWYQTSVVTGRISAKHPNFQALPRLPLQITKKQYIQGKEEEVVSVHPRAMFIPQEGWTFLAADFCQVELRLLAHLSSDPELLRIFTHPQADVFTMLASQWKGVSEGEVTSEDREHAKRIVYSVVYGAGRERLSGILGVSAEQASRFQDSFLQTYREVQAFIQRTIQQCHKQGYVLSIMGRRRTLPNINSPDWGIRMQAERQAVNFVVQGSAADLCKMAMIRIFNLVSSSTSLSARLIAQLHDELLYEVEDSQVEQFAALVKSTMESLQHIDKLGVHLKVPLKVAVSSGKSWGSMSELNIPPTSPSPSL
ncbi:DNA polymerase nu [Pagrus major]|uniref:DNA polymerase nu n=1 Tax=Pagrus major TaxID=143350 RepID=UPI003CC83E4A